MNLENTLKMPIFQSLKLYITTEKKENFLKIPMDTL